MGFSLPLDCFDIEVDIAKPAALATRPKASEAGQWSMRSLDIADGYPTAVAVKGTIEELSIFLRYNEWLGGLTTER